MQEFASRSGEIALGRRNGSWEGSEGESQFYKGPRIRDGVKLETQRTKQFTTMTIGTCNTQKNAANQSDSPGQIKKCCFGRQIY